MSQPSSIKDVAVVQVPSAIIDSTLTVLREFGKKDLEGLVLWLGQVDGNAAQIVKLVVPEQYPLADERGVGYFVHGDALFELNRMLSQSGLRLLAQVHSHPGEAYHSEADDRYAIVTAEGGFSLVVPNFGLVEDDLSLWAVYRLLDGEWVELEPDAVRAMFVVAENA